jgi:hypothetical protein
MRGEYRNFGVHFLYPENWLIVDEELNEWPRRVSVQSPESGYWEIQAYPPSFRPEDLSERTLAAFREEYEDIDSEAVSEDLLEHRTTGYDLNFFCLDFLVTCQVRSFCLGSHTLLLIWQAESREFEKRRDVFAAITRSLLLEDAEARMR